MSVTITISDDGQVEAMHNSGRILWSLELDATDDTFDEDLANWIGEVTAQYAD
ncbi:hypothetical protein [Haloarcula sp. CGMCC 1.6347]|uniref:hypothetical protein n=1 Tax=Haloarcula sp. CGMCC 1.6347 TaxID=3111455 RepID=UPI00300F6C52